MTLKRGPAVADWQLERYLLGELPSAEAELVRDALARDAGLRERVAELQRSNEEVLVLLPPRVMAAAIRARAAMPSEPAPRPAGRRIPRPAVVGALGLVTAAVAGVVSLPAWRTQPAAETRVKGLAPQIVLYRRAPASGREPLTPGATARRGDVVQIAYQAAGRRYGVVVSIDGSGVVTRHLPAAGAEAAPLEAGVRPLGSAFQLDDAPGFESFHFVTANEPFLVEAVVAAAGRAGRGTGGARLDLPPSFEQSSFLLKKESLR